MEPWRNGWSNHTWSRFDDFYSRARAAGLTPIMNLAFAPTWARDLLGRLCGALSSECLYPPRPGMDGEWGEFAAEAARRYPAAIFEIWNEPNLPGSACRTSSSGRTPPG